MNKETLFLLSYLVSLVIVALSSKPEIGIVLMLFVGFGYLKNNN